MRRFWTVRGANTAVVPDADWPPGFISIVANEPMNHLEELDSVKLRVGALLDEAFDASEGSAPWRILTAAESGR